MDPGVNTQKIGPANGLITDSVHLEPPALWTVSEVARYLRLRPDTIRAMVRRNELPGTKIGRVWRFEPEAVRAWFHERGK